VPPGPARALFVYGTLKRGLTNYRRYLGPAEEHGKATFLGAATTLERFPLVVRPAHMLPATRAPVLISCAGTGHRVSGEVFRVDDSTMDALDILEGVHRGVYHKEEVAVSLDHGAEQLTCSAYLYPENKELLSLPLLPAYSLEHHQLYRPGPVQQEILALCRPTHGLRTAQPHAMRAHCLRLLPGEDLLASLRAFAELHGLRAAAVLACVGSTGRTRLRPAGATEPRVFDGKHEIVSLTGTLGTGGHHLHMSISNPECCVFGGHVLEGCIIRTTAEIVLGLIDGLHFARPVDDRTGHRELSIISDPAEAPECAPKRRRLDGDAPGC